MADLKKKNIFTTVLASASVIIITVFLFSVISILAAGNLQKANLRVPAQLSEADNILGVYAVSGKIMDIQGKTIILETPVFDAANKR